LLHPPFIADDFPAQVNQYSVTTKNMVRMIDRYASFWVSLLSVAKLGDRTSV